MLPRTENGRTPHWPALLVLSLALTALNSVKPLQVDDAAYYYYAAHIARHPFDPYGFEIFWYREPEPANHVLAPPVMLYWWAAAIRLFGERPFLWKLWMWPFSLIFVGSLYALFRRFARGLDGPLVWMTVVSPVFLPGFNLMLDIPALALSLLAVVVFFNAYDRDSQRRAAVAGLLAGVAMETKYTAFLAPAIMLLYAFVSGGLSPTLPWSQALRRMRLGFVAAAIAVGVFILWEALVAWKYGESHFWHEFQEGDRDSLLERFQSLTLPLVTLLGGVAPVVALLNLAALGRRCWLWVVAGWLVVAYGAVACFEADLTVAATPSSCLVESPLARTMSCSLERLVFTATGGLVILTLAAVIWRLLRVERGGLWRPSNWRRHRHEWFLVLWLALEVAGAFLLTPFPAARRLMGMVVVATLVAGRLARLTQSGVRGQRSGVREESDQASRSSLTPDSRPLIPLVWGIALASAVLGMAFWALDCREAQVRKNAAEGAAAWIRNQEPRATIWYVGHWGFQFYAERAGMKPVVPDDPRRPLQAGDWLVVPDARLPRQNIQLDGAWTKPVAELAFADCVPLRTVQCYYGTSQGVPLEHHDGPRIAVTIYRVTVRH
jgi:hypothetical protein